MVFLECSWLYRTLEDSLDDIIQAKDQEMIKELVIRLLDYYAKQTDNSIDDKIVDLVRSKLFNTSLPEDNLFGMMKSLASFLPACEYRSELMSGISYIQENFNKPMTEQFSSKEESEVVVNYDGNVDDSK
jgi:DNA polymerase III delta prime subunit